jgi:hypothetical protein
MRKSGVVAWITGISLVAVFSACSDKTRVPSDVLDREEMEAVMWDMILADRYAITYLPMDSVKRKDIKSETLKLYDQVFQVHKISREEFIKSYKFYLSRPDISKVMFDSIASRANRKRDEQYNKPPETPVPSDSAATAAAGLAARKLDSLRRIKVDSVAKVRFDSVARKRTDSLSKKKMDSVRRRLDSLSKRRSALQLKRGS